MRRTFHVFELAALDGPEEDVGDDCYEDQAERDQEIEDVHESGWGDCGWVVHSDVSLVEARHVSHRNR